MLVGGHLLRNGLVYDLLAIALDGTLLDTQHRLPARNREALHRAHQAGLKIVICTGRAFPETQPTLTEIGLDLDAAVSVFGAVITDVATGNTLARTPLALDVAFDLTDWFRRRHYAILWLLDRQEAGFDGYILDGPRRHEAYDRWIRVSPCEIRATDRPPADSAAPVRITIIDDLRTLEVVSRDLAAAFDGRITHNVLRAPNYDLTVIEAFAPQVSKWFAIRKLCERWRIDPRRTVAIGDDVNDLDMLRQAGLGVAMANARPAVKTAADRVTAGNDDCGVAVLIDELLGA